MLDALLEGLKYYEVCKLCNIQTKVNPTFFIIYHNAMWQRFELKFRNCYFIRSLH